ncbi:unnamed protein product [Rhizophagus irregularis]|uniref:Actin-like ATPase domain-containing protein n=1 Tax=Rhizophagus irregularis TaxID=588596 RepID=A0A915ZNL9_9GLOM|nr:unnamed protein product [Rhizophagus irregularis]
MSVQQDEVSDIRVVIGLDFGTTYSGFAYCHVSDEDNVCSNVLWCGEAGQVKTNTVLQYDNDYNEVKLWGAPALAKKQGRKKRRSIIIEDSKPVELFKLHLGDLSEKHKPKLPVCYKKAITDYLREICKIIKETVATAWPMVDYFENVLLVITIPAEFSETAKAIMRTCAFDAGLIKKKYSTNLQFTTEPEAAAIYCMKKNLNEQALAQPGTNFMIVDCGGGTVDVTTRKLLNEGQLGEITERAGNNRRVISSRILKYSYGCDMWKKWEHGDPIDRRTPEGFIAKFKRLAKRGTTMGIDQEVTVNRVPIFENQDNMITKIYYTREYDAEYCDDPGVMPLGDLIVDLPGEGFNRRILFGLTFGKMEIIATSRDKQTGQSYRTTFKFNLDE